MQTKPTKNTKTKNEQTNKKNKHTTLVAQVTPAGWTSLWVSEGICYFSVRDYSKQC